MTIQTVDPSTGVAVAAFDPHDSAEVEKRLALAGDTFRRWRRVPIDERAALLVSAADEFEAREDQLARLITLEMGRPLEGALAEVRKCSKGLRYYAARGPEFLADQAAVSTEVGARKAWVRWDPIGPVLAIMPWNYPLWQVVRFAAPALMAGNVCLLKHASNVPQLALQLEEVFIRAGFPVGGFQTLLVETPQVAGIIEDNRVAAVTLTGSEGAGRAVASVAGRAIKKTVLELGGSDCFIVLPSADLEAAASAATASRLQNAGQSCICAKRFIVHADVHEAFLEQFTQQMRAAVVGDPLKPSTSVGPLATEQGRNDIQTLVDDAVARGATVKCGGTPIPGPGWYYPPTVLSDVTRAMRVWREELFGPVATVVAVGDIDEAIGIANDSPFGLGSNAWTQDESEQSRLIAEIEAGAVFVNGVTASYPELPFGGIKASGYGRELAAMGMYEFCNAKTVWVG